MTPDEHYAEAEKLLRWSESDDNPDRHFQDRDWLVARAHVHALLAAAYPVRIVQGFSPTS